MFRIEQECFLERNENAGQRQNGSPLIPHQLFRFLLIDLALNFPAIPRRRDITGRASRLLPPARRTTYVNPIMALRTE